jgi:dTDP-4-amino-4,6-dideoxygalactose transaminase
MTTGEGGMAVTENAQLAGRMKHMSLHGLSHDAWKRYSGNSAWDYQIVAAGYKYNLTDIAAAIGNCQLRRAEPMRRQREEIACNYRRKFADVEQLELPPSPGDRIHSWHLFPIRLNLEKMTIDRNAFIEEIRRRGIGCSVHWRPLHLHPYYQDAFGWRDEHLPVATSEWTRIVSLPLFPGMTTDEQDFVVRTVKESCR